jgi:Cu(I)/Ag(I) efflux system membrane fusion protein
MTRARRNWILAGIAGLLLLAGGTAGWWLAMRAMPMEEAASGAGDGTSGMPGMEGMAGTEDRAGAGGMEAGPQPSPALVRVDPVRLQRSGVRYAVAELEPLDRTVRAEASIGYDEERRAYVTTKIAGWVETLHVDEPGQTVRRGQPLLEIYSPELVSTQQELVLALEHADRPSARGAPADTSGSFGAGHGGVRTPRALAPERLVESARRRLELWDVPQAEIERLVRTREVRRTLTLAAPVGGVVVEKRVLQGARVEPGENLYLIADVSTVWVEARVFEADLAELRVGQPATIAVEAYPGETFAGTVGFIYPYLDPMTRTVAVRLEVPNPAGRLKPGMFATVLFHVSGAREAVVVPASAVIETGERAFVLVKRGEGLFEPREVEVGARAADEVAIAQNLAAGDTVVASANFLIDSESNLMAFMGGMLGMGMRADQMRMGGSGVEEMQGMEDVEGMEGTDGTKGMGRMEGTEGSERTEGTDGMERREGMEGTDSAPVRGLRRTQAR